MFAGSTRGFGTHRSRLGNGDERHVRIVPPSVIMAAPTMKSSRKTKKQLQDDDMNCSDTCHCPHLSSHQHASVNKIIKHVTFSVLFVFYSSDDLKLMWLCKEHIVINYISSCGFGFHCNFHN